MSAVAAKPTAGGAVDMTAMIIGIIILLIVIAATYFLSGIRPGLYGPYRHHHRRSS